VAVLNRDDSSYDYLARIPADIHITYGLTVEADVRAQHVECTNSTTSFLAVTPAGRYAVRSHLVGAYNAYNILAAIATTASLGISADHIVAGIASLTGVIGRTERIEEGQPFTVLVDFAHTPNALRQVLLSVRRLTGAVSSSSSAAPACEMCRNAL